MDTVSERETFRESNSAIFSFTSFLSGIQPLKEAALQIRGGIEDNSKIIFLLLNKNIIWCDPSLEPSQRDGSNDGSQQF